MSVTVGRMRRDKGISVARPSALGNPFVIGRDGDRADVIGKFRVWFAEELPHNPSLRDAFARILKAARRGDVTLLCWCAPLACHADVIADEVRRRFPLHHIGGKL